MRIAESEDARAYPCDYVCGNCRWTIRLDGTEENYAAARITMHAHAKECRKAKS